LSVKTFVPTMSEFVLLDEYFPPPTRSHSSRKLLRNTGQAVGLHRPAPAPYFRQSRNITGYVCSPLKCSILKKMAIDIQF
jgi:hypothetical protein